MATDLHFLQLPFLKLKQKIRHLPLLKKEIGKLQEGSMELDASSFQCKFNAKRRTLLGLDML